MDESIGPGRSAAWISGDGGAWRVTSARRDDAYGQHHWTMHGTASIIRHRPEAFVVFRLFGDTTPPNNVK
jgi:hypothetical protein